MDARYFGSEIAAQLGLDHEANTINSPDEQNVRNSQMDIHNNGIGVLTFNNNSPGMDFRVKMQVDTWAGKVQDMMNAGYFYYLSEDGLTRINSNQ